MKIYTKTGDGGETSLYRGGRVSKAALRIRACGEVDELNSLLGWLRSSRLSEETSGLIEQIQNELFTIGSDLAAPAESVGARDQVTRLASGKERYLEEEIDRMEIFLPPLKQFILPGGDPSAATAHLARSVCRRAERAVVELAQGESVSQPVLIYLNRLSDFLFVLARYLNHQAGGSEINWKRESP